jgi:hypothetical protein
VLRTIFPFSSFFFPPKKALLKKNLNSASKGASVRPTPWPDTKPGFFFFLVFLDF